MLSLYRVYTILTRSVLTCSSFDTFKVFNQDILLRRFGAPRTPRLSTKFIKNQTMTDNFKMVAKTLKGLEAVLADELRQLGAQDVEPGRRMVSFTGDLAMLYKANLCCRTALRILKPFYEFTASDPDTLYDEVKKFDWSTLLDPDKTFAIDTVVNSESFNHSRFVTYRVKDAIADWFTDRYDKRPGVRLTDADVLINVHILGTQVTLSLDSSGDSLHKRGWRKAQTEAPINEVLAAGIILLSGYRGDRPFVDPMCGSGTFLVEAALIAANINPGVFRSNFAFERWANFDAELFDSLYNDDSQEREIQFPIIGADISPAAVDIARRNLRAAGVAKYVDIQVKPLARWEEAPAAEGIIVTNPPYGERISAPDMEAFYKSIGTVLKHTFTGWTAWIIGYKEEYFRCIGLAPSEKISMLNGSLDCELRQYVMFAGNKRDFRAAGGRLKEDRPKREDRPARRQGRSDDRFEGGGVKKSGFRRDRSDKFSRGGDKFGPRGGDKFAARKGGFRDDRRDERDKEEIENENPLARRRSLSALKWIESNKSRQPSLPPQEGPIMRSRGWKKKD
jgi:putative N6-adenine-specific DNA methylase